MSQKKPKPGCNMKIYRRGKSLAVITRMPKKEAQELVDLIQDEARVKLTWHYCGSPLAVHIIHQGNLEERERARQVLGRQTGIQEKILKIYSEKDECFHEKFKRKQKSSKPKKLPTRKKTPLLTVIK